MKLVKQFYFNSCIVKKRDETSLKSKEQIQEIRQYELQMQVEKQPNQHFILKEVSDDENSSHKQKSNSKDKSQSSNFC